MGEAKLRRKEEEVTSAGLADESATPRPSTAGDLVRCHSTAHSPLAGCLTAAKLEVGVRFGANKCPSMMTLTVLVALSSGPRRLKL